MTNAKFAPFFLACLATVLLARSLPAAEPEGRMPILVVTDKYYADNKFGNYLTEVLRGEGLVQFEQTERNLLQYVSSELLQSYDTVILAEMDLNAVDEALLRGYVQSGGTLIAMRPDADLADLFGVTVEGNRPEQLLQYFGVSPDLPAGLPQGMGIVDTSLQYHGEATNYGLAGASSVASLYSDAQTPSANAAVTLNYSGQGKAVAFAFDMAKSITLTRQGNPDWQNTEGDGLSQYRPMDMFMRSDGRTYYDPDKMTIPQADEAQRLLANVVVTLSDKPLPRMWYLPGTHKTLMVNTGDAEDMYGAQLDACFDDAAAYGGYYTAYLRNVGISNTTPEQEAAWRAAGHEVGVHMWAGGAEGAGAEAAINAAYGDIVAQLESKFGHVSRTARNHTIDWTGWVYSAAIEAAHGTGMDMNYYHYINSGSPLDNWGYFTGSGLPQRFIDAPGQMLSIYQATTQWPDEWFADKGLSVQQTVDLITGMFEAAEENGFYSAFVNNIHQIRYSGVDPITPLWPSIVWQYCQEHDIPSWSGEMLLDFVEARDASQFDNITWDIEGSSGQGTLEFDFSTPIGGQDLTVMVPALHEGHWLREILADGQSLTPIFEEIKGIKYAMFTTQDTALHIQALYAALFAGDANHDGKVDAADAALLAANWLATDANWDMGDFNADGMVNDIDATMLAANWQAGVATNVTVPEPGIAILLVGLVCAMGILASRNASGSHPAQN